MIDKLNTFICIVDIYDSKNNFLAKDTILGLYSYQYFKLPFWDTYCVLCDSCCRSTFISIYFACLGYAQRINTWVMELHYGQWEQNQPWSSEQKSTYPFSMFTKPSTKPFALMGWKEHDNLYIDKHWYPNYHVAARIHLQEK